MDAQTPMAGRRQDTGKLARTLVLDELFDLSLYEMLRNSTRGDLRRMLEELIPIETKHFAFWQEFFGTQIETLDWRVASSSGCSGLPAGCSATAPSISSSRPSRSTASGNTWWCGRPTSTTRWATR